MQGQSTSNSFIPRRSPQSPSKLRPSIPQALYTLDPPYPPPMSSETRTSSPQHPSPIPHPPSIYSTNYPPQGILSQPHTTISIPTVDDQSTQSTGGLWLVELKD
ncbi:hypothetical protein K432DRAFT_139674 [Lepidopterella palustris CBS 459.81]|uniref:Uncharacterized protein n=1 Tax=Lepidopterella palustris CBS 459.81 TaxID=1314670 RepID=A0A8E2E3R0_9PEZI|nr:hypothetical protein K432DRAFT_139674 [Lepidopterella palustris CBS 459.81]